MNVGVISLGCAKNQVDTERMLSLLSRVGYAFTPDPADMLNDAFLGLSVVAFALVVWLIILLIRDPKGIVRKALARK